MPKRVTFKQLYCSKYECLHSNEYGVGHDLLPLEKKERRHSSVTSVLSHHLRFRGAEGSSAWMKCEDIESRGSSTVNTSINMDVWSSTVRYHECSRHSNDPLPTHSCSLLDADILHSTWVDNFYYNSFQTSPGSLYDDIMMLEPTENTDCSKMVKPHVCKMVFFLNTVTDAVL